MKKDVLVIEGRAYSWRDLCELRRKQEAERRAALPRQLQLFEMRDDCRPACERMADGRYREPTFLDRMLGSEQLDRAGKVQARKDD